MGVRRDGHLHRRRSRYSPSRAVLHWHRCMPRGGSKEVVVLIRNFCGIIPAREPDTSAKLSASKYANANRSRLRMQPLLRPCSRPAVPLLHLQHGAVVFHLQGLHAGNFRQPSTQTMFKRVSHDGERVVLDEPADNVVAASFCQHAHQVLGANGTDGETAAVRLDVLDEILRGKLRRERLTALRRIGLDSALDRLVRTRYGLKHNV